MTTSLTVPPTTTSSTAEALTAQVRERYAAAARSVGDGHAACCGDDCGCGGGDPITRDLYDAQQVAHLPADAVKASLGCGNPTLLAALEPGQVVLDLGSGGGLDVLLSARRVGPTGKAYGLDMTPEMLALARANQRRAGIDNAEFLEGRIEAIPLPEATVDVVISNCVINLSADKPRALAEAFRVLKPGGLLAVSDIVVRGPVPEPVRRSVELWLGCIAGALEEDHYRRLLHEAGFEAVEVEPTRVYTAQDAAPLVEAAGLGDVERLAAEVDGRFLSAFVRARKPAAPPTA
jgi:SAM-dependent methyltransferase